MVSCIVAVVTVGRIYQVCGFVTSVSIVMVTIGLLMAMGTCQKSLKLFLLPRRRYSSQTGCKICTFVFVVYIDMSELMFIHMHVHTLIHCTHAG